MIKLQENSLRAVKDSIMPALEFSVVGQIVNNQILADFLRARAGYAKFTFPFIKKSGKRQVLLICIKWYKKKLRMT
jgi:hypothetical protein